MILRNAQLTLEALQICGFLINVEKKHMLPPASISICGSSQLQFRGKRYSRLTNFTQRHTESQLRFPLSCTAVQVCV